MSDHQRQIRIARDQLTHLRRLRDKVVRQWDQSVRQQERLVEELERDAPSTDRERNWPDGHAG